MIRNIRRRELLCGLQQHNERQISHIHSLCNSHAHLQAFEFDVPLYVSAVAADSYSAADAAKPPKISLGWLRLDKTNQIEVGSETMTRQERSERGHLRGRTRPVKGAPRVSAAAGAAGSTLGTELLSPTVSLDERVEYRGSPTFSNDDLVAKAPGIGVDGGLENIDADYGLTEEEKEGVEAVKAISTRCVRGYEGRDNAGREHSADGETNGLFLSISYTPQLLTTRSVPGSRKKRPESAPASPHSRQRAHKASSKPTGEMTSIIMESDIQVAGKMP